MLLMTESFPAVTTLNQKILAAVFIWNVSILNIETISYGEILRKSWGVSQPAL